MSLGGSLVSIGVPVYNGETFLSDALSSLLAQDYGDIELIISDNASTDRTASIAEEYARQDPRLRYYRSHENLGAIPNFNRTLELASGRYFMWAACDDIWERNFIKELVKLLDGANSAIAFCRFDSIDETGHHLRSFDLRRLIGLDLESRLKRYLVLGVDLGGANSIHGLMRTEMLRCIGGFRPWNSRGYGVDMNQMFRVLCCGEIVLSDQLLFHKRRSANDWASYAACVSRMSTFKRLQAHWARYLNIRGMLNGYVRVLKEADIEQGVKHRLKRLIGKQRCKLNREICKNVGRVVVRPGLVGQGVISPHSGVGRAYLATKRLIFGEEE